MRDHIRQAKNNSQPACSSYGTSRGVFGISPALFNGSNDKCKKCEVIFEKRRSAQMKREGK